MPIYVIDKPLGLTSHDAVARARKSLKTRAVGHAGTLDPLATGVLVLLVDEATKLSPFLSSAQKHYLAWVSFGAQSPTLDAEGPLTPVAAPAPTKAQILAALPAFLALSEQVPPQFSAVKQGGVKSYEAARKGVERSLPARPATYAKISLLDYAASRDGLEPPPLAPPAHLPAVPLSLPTALFALEVGAGTYIRSFARDLGERLGAPAFLSGLVRTASGRFTLQDAAPLEALPMAPKLAMAEALSLPQLHLSEEETARVQQGQRLPSAHLNDGTYALIGAQGALIAVSEVRAGRMAHKRVWV